MIISVKDSLIRRVEGSMGGGDKVVMDYTNIRTNQGMPDSRFTYDAPATVKRSRTGSLIRRSSRKHGIDR